MKAYSRKTVKSALVLNYKCTREYIYLYILLRVGVSNFWRGIWPLPKKHKKTVYKYEKLNTTSYLLTCHFNRKTSRLKVFQYKISNRISY